jgi:hypothetical protein
MSGDSEIQQLIEKLRYRADRLNANYAAVQPSFAADCVGVMRDAATSLAALTERAEQAVRREAEHHDIIAKLWSIVDPELQPELMTLVHGVLGLNDPDGLCGNRICHELHEAEQRTRAAEALVQTLQDSAQTWQPIETAPKDGQRAAACCVGRITAHNLRRHDERA